jgi:transcription elongation GreA/GreB family factor
MSRAFVKETDGEEVAENLPERPQSPHPNYVTPSGLQSLLDRVRELLERKRELSGLDDLGARQELPVVERDLRYYGDRVKTAILVDPTTHPDDRVHFGATVVVRGEHGVQSFAIVGEDEADVASGKISWISPLAKALLNAQVGDWVTWKRPAGDQELEVLSIRKADVEGLG